jgi:hypothetical protein
MTLNYSDVWKSLNDLEAITSKICSAREILDSAIEALDSNKQTKAETLMYATDEYLEYYLKDFDEKFKVAWGEIVLKLKNENISNIDPAGNYVNFPVEQYTEEEINAMCDLAEEQHKVKKWILPISEIEDIGTLEKETYIELPDDLLEETGWKEYDELEWVDNKDGTFTLRKVND